MAIFLEQRKFNHLKMVQIWLKRNEINIHEFNVQSNNIYDFNEQ